MIVEYDPKTLEHHHVLTMYPTNYADILKESGRIFVESAEKMDVKEIEVVLVEGKPFVRRRQPLEVVAPLSLTMGVEAAFSGIPEGVSISINGESKGAMDTSGALEFTAEHAGHYLFRFEGSGWIMKEFRLEAVTRN